MDGRTLPLRRAPPRPGSAVTSVTDGNGNAVTACRLERTPTGDRLRFTGAATFPLTVVYEAGFASAAAVPAAIRVAILTHTATLYENRESVAPRAMAVVPHSLEHFYRLRTRRPGVG